MILRKEVIESLNKKLELPYTGIEQDWELEMANSERVYEFVCYYKENIMINSEKIALVSLILASYDDLLNEEKEENEQLWNHIRGILECEEDLFSELIIYWSVPNENSAKNWFKITPLIRKIG